MRCPECGEHLRFLTGESLIEWERRAEIGFWRALWSTARQAMFHTRRLAVAIQVPVRYADAVRFRWVAVNWAFGALVTTIVVTAIAQPNILGGLIDQYGVVSCFVFLALTYLTLGAISGAPSYLFHPRSLSLARQNRAVALSYYASAPLFLMPIPAVFLLLALTPWIYHRWLGYVIGYGLVVSLCLIPLLMWWNLVRLAQRTLLSFRDTMNVAILTPVLWLTIASLLLFLLPLLFLYVEVIFVSLR